MAGSEITDPLHPGHAVVETLLALVTSGSDVSAPRLAVVREAIVAGYCATFGGTVTRVDGELVDPARLDAVERRAAIIGLDLASEGSARPADDVRATLASLMAPTLVHVDPVMETPPVLGEVRALAMALSGSPEPALEAFRLSAAAWAAGRALAALRAPQMVDDLIAFAGELRRDLSALPEAEDRAAIDELLEGALEDLADDRS
ncbi:MAG: hypothetical protein H7123_07475 [Thermoleophilia bacterium]|nr:hypothetical protein [Thermoleophilia bacterium]